LNIVTEIADRQVVWANITNFSEFGVSGDIYVPPAQQYISSGGGGGGGGGGGPSGENFTNIEVKENYDLHIFIDKVTSYRYANRSNPVMFVNVTGNISAGEINAAVEVLRNTSTLIKPQTPAPGIVYKNVNIWVGTTGFAVPKNIKIAAIKFKVLNTWLESNSITANEIRMVRWDGSKWVTLDIGVKEKDSTNTYFEATTDTFSPFAITGFKEVSKAAHAVVVTETPTKQAETATATAVPAKKGIPGFEATIAISVIALLAASLRNDRKRR
jgi:PGF-pre-PGF domain-containing protein